MSSEGEHLTHYNHPKIAKNTSNKLPDAFLQSKVTKKVPINVQKQKIKQQLNQKQQKSQIQKQKGQVVKQKYEVAKSDIIQKKPRQSRNPFLPIRKLKQQMQKFAIQSLALHQLYSIPLPSSVQSVSTQLPYQSFITLTLITKKQTTVLKKVLHVPQMKVYFMREQIISIGVDKNQLIEWMKGTNQISTADRASAKGNIKQLYWNVPQGYYSLLYQYYDGYLMQTLLTGLSILPLKVIQNIANSYFTNNVGIYNSQLILNINQTKDTPQIYYIPIYQQTPPIIRSQKLHQILMSQIQEDDFDRKIIWRLGIILMASFIGEQFVRSDLLQVSLPLKSCCLFHSVLQVQNSLSLLYLSQNQLFQQSSSLISFLCHLLSCQKSPTFTTSLSQPKLKKHKFLTQQFQSLLTLKQLFHTISMIDLQDEQYALGQFGSDHKLHKIIQIISMGLQNVKHRIHVDFSQANSHVGYIAQELGLKNHRDKVVNCLRQVYNRQAR